MKHRLFWKPSLICIKTVFFILSVKCNKAFMVHTVFAALCAGVGSKVKHIPNMSCPHIRPFCYLLDYFFVIICLVFLCIIALFGIACVPIKSLASVLAHTNCFIRIFLMEIIKPIAIHWNITAVPAKIMVIRKHIGNMHIFLIDIARCKNRFGGRPCFINWMNKVI